MWIFIIDTDVCTHTQTYNTYMDKINVSFLIRRNVPTEAIFYGSISFNIDQQCTKLIHKQNLFIYLFLSLYSLNSRERKRKFSNDRKIITSIKSNKWRIELKKKTHIHIHFWWNAKIMRKTEPVFFCSAKCCDCQFTYIESSTSTNWYTWINTWISKFK